MDTALLVDSRLEDGQKFIDEIRRDGFEVTGAFWVRTSADDDRWSLCVVSPLVTLGKAGEAFARLYVSVSKVAEPPVPLSEINLLSPLHPAALAAQSLRERYPGRRIIPFQGKRLGDLAVEEAYIYPKPGKWFKGFDEIKKRFPSAEAFSIMVAYPGSATSSGAFSQGFAAWMGKINAAPFEGKEPGTVLFMGPAESDNRSAAELVFVYRPEGWNKIYYLSSGAAQTVGFEYKLQAKPLEEPHYEPADFGPFSANRLRS